MSDDSILDATKRDRFELISAYLDGEVTPAERLLVTNWLAHDPEVQRLYRRLLLLRQAFRAMPSQPVESAMLTHEMQDYAQTFNQQAQATDHPLSLDREAVHPYEAAVAQQRRLSRPAALKSAGYSPSLWLGWQHSRLRAASLALAFTAATLFVTSLTGLVNGRILPWQLTHLMHSEGQSAPHLDGSNAPVPELALDEPAIDLPQDSPIEETVH